MAGFVIALVTGLGLVARVRKKKPSEDMPASLLVVFVGFLLLLLAAQYSQQRPYNPVAVIISVVLSLIIVGLFGFLLWPFRELHIFVKEKRYAAIRFFAIVYLYSIYFVIVSRGFIFLFNGIINPEIISLTPEFERFVIPTLSVLILAIYRLTRISSSKAVEFLNEISRDVMLFAVLMFWLGSSASIVGVTISADLSIQTYGESMVVGVIGGMVLIGFEGLLIWLQNDLSKMGRKFSLDQVLRSWFEVLISRRKRATQKTLDEFFKTHRPITTKTPQGLDRAIKLLDNRFSLCYRERTLRASSLLILAVSFLSVILVGGFMVSHDVIVLAPAHSVELDIVTETQLPPYVEVITSESVESLVVGKVYAIPIVSIHSLNSSFNAPLSNRFLFLNSSGFIVLKTGQYLTLCLTKTYVETKVRAKLISGVEYNQTNNSCFDYIGFFREAEIFYCLKRFGYDQIITLSTSSLQGLMMDVQKLIFACNSTNDTAFIYIQRTSETGVIEDKTCFISLNTYFINQAIFLIEQTKSITTCIQEIANATNPFHMP